MVPAGLLAVWLLGVLVRLFMQDRLHGFWAYGYYATPPIVLAGLALLAGLWWLIPRHWKCALPTLALGLGCLVWAFRVTWFFNPPATPGPDSKRVLFWNVAWGAGGWAEIVSEIRARDADIIGLVESRRKIPVSTSGKEIILAAQQNESQRMQAFWREQLPEYHVTVFGNGISLLSKCDLTQVEEGLLGGNYHTAFGYYAHGEVPLGNETLHIVVVDVKNMLQQSRVSPLRNLYQLLGTLDDQPVLLVGDFNTPTDSVYLRPLRRRFSNAFEFAGHGYAATWPLPVPLLTIDQAWVNEEVHVSRCEFGWPGGSDHRSIEVEVSVVP
ncbi:MAG: endonuclease/exonuclease/phosphatase family protein [Phycisphaerae bacterium]|nr:endonuclease/exonuclease/phosphatase family protein [Phycisphaerae bacterium]